MKAQPRWPVTNPPVSRYCMDAIRSCLTADTSLRIGAASWESFTHHPFFAEIDFEALVRKEIDPVFIPSSEKTNFDATYDLEELLLEEAPLEARARRQKPREGLKENASAQEIREDELHRMIETLFEPFDYTAAVYEKYGQWPSPQVQFSNKSFRYPGTVDPNTGSVGPPPEWVRPSNENPPHPPRTANGEMPPRSAHAHAVTIDQPHSYQAYNHTQTPLSQTVINSSSQINSPSSGSPPLRTDETIHARTTNGSTADHHYQHHPQQVQRSSSAGNNTRNASASGTGVQVVLDEAGSWSALADQSAQPPQKNKPSGMLGFLSKRKGRASSPKPQERGVLGREGARVIIAG